MENENQKFVSIETFAFVVTKLLSIRWSLADWKNLSLTCKYLHSKENVFHKISNFVKEIVGNGSQNNWVERMTSVSLYYYGNVINPLYQDAPWCPSIGDFEGDGGVGHHELYDLIIVGSNLEKQVPVPLKKQVMSINRFLSRLFENREMWIKKIQHLSSLKTKDGDDWCRIILFQMTSCFENCISPSELDQIYPFFPEVDEMVYDCWKQASASNESFVKEFHLAHVKSGEFFIQVGEFWKRAKNCSAPKTRQLWKEICTKFFDHTSFDQELLEAVIERKRKNCDRQEFPLRTKIVKEKDPRDSAYEYPYDLW